MPSSGQNRYDDQLVIQYLLGSTPEQETDRLDELSITDDEFATQLRAAENDLVDAYVRGELEGETLQRFKSFYLVSPSRLEKVQFAEALETLADRSPVAPRAAWSGWASTLSWSFAGAACVLVLTTGYLFIENRRLQGEFVQEQSRRVALEQSARALQKQLDDYRASAKTPPDVPSRPPTPAILAFVLSPQTRGVGSLSTVAVPAGTDRVVLQLMLESDDFPGYRAGLRDPAVNQIVWRSGGLKAVSKGENRMVTVSVPGALLKQQNYSLELAGVRATGTEELVDTYAFRITTK